MAWATFMKRSNGPANRPPDRTGRDRILAKSLGPAKTRERAVRRSLDRLIMATRFLVASTLLASVVALAACGSSKPNPTDPIYIGNGGPGSGVGGDAAGSIFGDGGLSFGTAKTRNDEGGMGGAGGGLGVNAYLWRGALDTLGFMPLASADPFGGVIITDWYTPSGSTGGERFKATAYILGRQLRSDGIRVAIFRQVLTDGQWVDAPVSPVTVNEIENKVLARARQLREQSNPT